MSKIIIVNLSEEVIEHPLWEFIDKPATGNYYVTRKENIHSVEPK